MFENLGLFPKFLAVLLTSLTACQCKTHCIPKNGALNRTAHKLKNLNSSLSRRPRWCSELSTLLSTRALLIQISTKSKSNTVDRIFLTAVDISLPTTSLSVYCSHESCPMYLNVYLNLYTLLGPT